LREIDGWPRRFRWHDDPDQHRIVIREAPTAGVDPRQDPRVFALMEDVGKLVP
jgi:hypothetical protein